MPTYMIEGKKVQTESPLSDAEIDEIASSIKPAQAPSTTDQLKRQAGLTARTAIEAASAPANAVLDFLSGVYNLGAQAVGAESRVPGVAAVKAPGLVHLGEVAMAVAFHELILADAQDDEIHRQFDTNVFGVLDTIYATLPHVIASKGRIALVSSVMGHLSMPSAISSPFSAPVPMERAPARRCSLARGRPRKCLSDKSIGSGC